VPESSDRIRLCSLDGPGLDPGEAKSGVGASA
jgi:hypothetical protein